MSLQVKDEFAGKRVKCPGCNAVATAPDGSQEQTEMRFEPPPQPMSIEDTGLNLQFLSDLALRILYFGGVMTGYEITNEVALPYEGVMEHIFSYWRQQRLVEVLGRDAVSGEATYQYELSDLGRHRAEEALKVSQYTGPAPVPLNDYSTMVELQTIKNVSVYENQVQEAFSRLVLDPRLVERLGPAINSGKSIFLYGPPGNGKTTIAETIAKLLGSPIFVPYALNLGNEIIRVFDETVHSSVEQEVLDMHYSQQSREGTGSVRVRRATMGQDLRWVLCKRPVVIVGGELTMTGLDLQYNPVNRFYEAPYQLKANCGVFVIDDLGRQLIRPQDLLNRWIVPLEKNIDYLTLHTGRKFDVPFDELIIFATNLDPKDLVDEAFLRRIRYKILVDSPTLEQYANIFELMCKHRNIEYDPAAVQYLFNEYYKKKGFSLRSCHPRDLLDQIMDIAGYQRKKPALTKEFLDMAWEGYFVEM